MTLHCIGNYEKNMYHDSYFMGVFWDDEKREIVTHEIGSTAYSGGMCSHPLTEDASVWDEVNAFVADSKAQNRLHARSRKAQRIRAARAILKDNGVHTAFTRRLTVEELEDIAALFSNRVRNGFKIKMRDVVRSWNPTAKYATPLSKRQMACIRRPETDKYGRPNALGNKRYIEEMLELNANSKFRGIGQR